MKLHITHDNVFIDYVINAANELECTGHKFLIITDNGKNAERVKNKNVFCAAYQSDAFHEFIGDLIQYEVVYIHWLYGNTARFVNALPNSIKVVWCFWGGEGLEMPEMLKDVYQPVSYKYFLNHNPNHARFSLVDMRGYFKRKRAAKNLFNENIKSIKRSNFFAHYLLDDYTLIKKYSGFKAGFLPFFYAPLNEIVPFNSALEIKGDDIMLGNSDTLTNNHFEAIDLLSDVDITGKKIFCPLSYENGAYAQTISDYGTKKLGEAFIPLRTYLAKEEYNGILSACSFGIMNHNRSQALGNILVLIWSGAKVFMSEQSSLFRFLEASGVLVFPFHKSFMATNNTVFKKLSLSEAEHNRQKLIQLFGKQKHREQMQQLFAI